MHVYMVEYTYKNKARGNTPKEIKNEKETVFCNNERTRYAD